MDEDGLGGGGEVGEKWREEELSLVCKMNEKYNKINFKRNSSTSQKSKVE